MGNSPSKNSPSKSNKANSPSKHLKAPPLTRTDTQNSAKSSKSTRSIRSKKSFSEPVSRSDSPLKSSRAPSRSNSFGNNEEQVTITNTTQTQPLPPSQLQSHQQTPNSLSRNGSSNMLLNVPASMVQIEPKEPILLRRNTNDNIEFNATSQTSSSFSSGKLSRTSTNNSLLNTPLSPQLTGGDNRSIASSIHSRVASAEDIPSLQKLPTKSSVTRTITNDDNTIDIEDLIQRLLDAGYSGKRTKAVCLKISEIQIICATAREIFLNQPSLLELSPPVKVVGDVHGQYGDLIRVFTKCGFPPSTNYLFLGDYVDRGKQSLETILLLLCYKIKYPENFFLLRGNHECANVTRVYGFYDECKRRCNIKTWKVFVDTFNTLPIAAIVAGKIFCVHGGLSPVLSSMDEIRNIARPTDVPDFGLLNDLLWSDPADTQNEWEDNERGVSYVFSKVAINKFLSKFGFDLVCRAHMVVEDGYEFFNDRTLVTVFSAPNYCGEFDNWGAVMSVSEELLCSFELLDPLDSVALKQVMKKGKQERKNAQISNTASLR